MMDQATMARAFNEWMDRYISDSIAFSRQFETIMQHLREKGAGKEPAYGDVCAAYLIELAKGFAA
jgi:hypothetical protein